LNGQSHIMSVPRVNVCVNGYRARADAVISTRYEKRRVGKE
jgi:hypothetical protein